MTVPTPPVDTVLVTLGIDTHRDAHVAVALDQLGRRLGTRMVATTPAGSAELLGWARQFGPLAQVGMEGTGSWALAWPASCATTACR